MDDTKPARCRFQFSLRRLMLWMVVLGAYRAYCGGRESLTPFAVTADLGNGGAAMTVDRKNRDALVAAINRYLDGQTTAFQFDGEIFGIKSDDPTVADPKAIILAPCSSLAELIALRRSVAKFGKRKYPPGMKPFKIRSPLEETAGWLRLYAAWLFFSPLVLLFQTLPTTETESRIVM